MNMDRGLILLVEVGELHRILFTRKTPQRHIKARNRREKHTIIHQFKSQNVASDHARIVSLFEAKRVVDDEHYDLWFKLTPSDVEFITSLKGESS
jgi:hypothetical protein